MGVLRINLDTIPVVPGLLVSFAGAPITSTRITPKHPISSPILLRGISKKGTSLLGHKFSVFKEACFHSQCIRFLVYVSSFLLKIEYFVNVVFSNGAILSLHSVYLSNILSAFSSKFSFLSLSCVNFFSMAFCTLSKKFVNFIRPHFSAVPNIFKSFV